MPCIKDSGKRGRKPDSNRAANISPEVSPATMDIIGRVKVNSSESDDVR